MTTMRTNLRNSRESARLLRFSPIGAVTQTNVQKAIEQLATIASGVLPTQVLVGNYQVLPTDQLIEVNFAGPVTITLDNPNSRNRLPLIIKDVSGNASTNNIQITGGVDGVDPLIIATDRGGYRIYPDTSTYRFMP